MKILPTDSVQTIADKLMTRDHLLYKFINNSLLTAEQTWNNPLYQEDIHRLRIGNQCPVNEKTRKYVSFILHKRYKEKENELKRTLLPQRTSIDDYEAEWEEKKGII